MAVLELPDPPAFALPLMERTKLLADGWTDRQIRWQLQTGLWTALRAGVYVDTALLRSLDADSARRHALDVEAARRRLKGETVASHESAAGLLGVSLLKSIPGVRLTRPDDQERHVQRYRDLLVRSAQLPPEHIHPGGLFGIPLTIAARMAVDLGRTGSLRESVVAVDSALSMGLTTSEELAALLEWAQQWPGAQLAAVMVKLADGRRESPFESESYVAMHECGLELPEPQVTIGDGSGRTARVDALWRRHHTVGEADGMGKYKDRADKIRERERHDWVDSMGFELVRWTPEEVLPYRLKAFRRKIESTWARAHRRWGD